MWNYINYNELYHHGIPGMKWGIRKVRDAIGGRVRGSRTLGQIARKTGYYTPSAAKGAIKSKVKKFFSNPTGRSIAEQASAARHGKKIVNRALNSIGSRYVYGIKGETAKYVGINRITKAGKNLGYSFRTQKGLLSNIEQSRAFYNRMASSQVRKQVHKYKGTMVKDLLSNEDRDLIKKAFNTAAKREARLRNSPYTFYIPMKL